MNKIIVISFTDKGAELNLKVTGILKQESDKVAGYSFHKYRRKGLQGFEKLQEWLPEVYQETEGILFIGAAGIAVRAVAPLLQGKEKDPAVLVMDEQANYIISLLSGHLGGGNKWCNHIAAQIGAVPVITTATDLNGKFAVDNFAKENQLKIVHTNQIKEISGSILAGKPVGFFSELTVEGTLPEGIVPIGLEYLETGICISFHENVHPFLICCNLVPMDLVVGIGCRKGKTEVELMEFLMQVLTEFHLSKYRIGKICSVEIKAKEEGMVALARLLNVPFVTYSKELLLAAEGVFSGSDFVKETVGIDNVCERSAVVGCKNIWNTEGVLLIPKQVKSGMTIAVAQSMQGRHICFM